MRASNQTLQLRSMWLLRLKTVKRDVGGLVHSQCGNRTGFLRMVMNQAPFLFTRLLGDCQGARLVASNKRVPGFQLAAKHNVCSIPEP